MEKQLSFEEILEREEYILVDTSFSTQNERNSSWYFNEVYPADHFSEISEGVLRYVRDDLIFFVSFLGNPNVYTSRGVALEVKNARKMVNEKIEYLEGKETKDSFSMELSDYGIFRKRLRRRNNNLNNGGNPQRELLREIRELFHESYCQSRGSVLPVQRNLYNPLENLVLEITEHTKAKRDFGYRYERPRSPKNNKKDFHTDEQLVSLALYLSSTRQENYIITGDSDLRRILFNTIRYLLDPEASDFKIDVLGSIETNRIRIYNTFFSGLEFDTSRPESMTRLPPEEVSKINQALAA